MEASFDNAAKNYDATFTNSEIGKLQRNLVYTQLSKHLDAVQTVLEVNCGTGEDAIWLAQQNVKVIATDISTKMIEVAQSKETFDNLKFQTADINSVTELFKNEKFDLLFSNFGGLNCLTKPELEKFFQDAPLILSEKGKLILVIMPKDTFWEQVYFLAKAQFSKAFQRKSEFAVADVDGEKVPTYYYNPKDIVNLAKQDFELIDQKPIGFFVPPSYMESFFRNKKGMLQFLNSLEKSISNWSLLSKRADHYIIILQKR